MKVAISSSRVIKPLYEGNPPPTKGYIPLSVFDKVTFDQHIAVIYAYNPPTPTTSTIELGLRKALSAYRVWAGRFGKDEWGNPIILLNDEGIRFVEAYVDRDLDQTVLLKPSTSLLTLHPDDHDVEELIQVQVTRFSCGSMVVGFTSHHSVADGNATSSFLVAWGKACRGQKIDPLPSHDRTIFNPRNPPHFEFEHRGVEYVNKNVRNAYPIVVDHSVDNIIVHKVHFTKEFILKLKAKASSTNGNGKPFSTFESLVSHLWRVITKARGLKGSESTQIRISVDGRSRLNPKVPNEYFGNLVLWAFPRAKVSDLLKEPSSHAAKVLHEAIVKVNDNYFKSFIDFANHDVKKEDLVPTADPDKFILWPDLEIHSWLNFPFYDLDLGKGAPYAFMPSFLPVEGLIFLQPSFKRDGGIDVFVTLFPAALKTFTQICYSLD